MSITRYGTTDEYEIYEAIEEPENGWLCKYSDYEELEQENQRLMGIIQKCFDDSCNPSGALSKATVLELMKVADTSA